MHVLRVGGVNEAYVDGLGYIIDQGKSRDSRAGKVIALDEPFAIVYERPLERVLFDPVRDANPFFHLFESLFLLAGRNDARWLDRFVGDFSSRFAEADGTLHGSYGYRWRRHFDLEGGGNPNMPDQLDTVVRLLKVNPDDRRVTIQMWDPVADLGQNRNDVPCNLMATPRIVDGLLHLTVFNRSNDFIWGLAGANAVKFSFLLEYLAGRIGVGVGTYTQISTNAHIYRSTIPRSFSTIHGLKYPKPTPIGVNWENWDRDLKAFFVWTETDLLPLYSNSWFWSTASTLYTAHRLWKGASTKQDALEYLKGADPVAPDWQQAAIAWMERRLARMAEPKEFDR